MQRLERSQKAFYTVSSLKRWLDFILNTIEAGFLVAVIAIAMYLPGASSKVGIGITLNILLGISTALRQLVDSWANLDISLGAVERLRGMQLESPKEEERRDLTVPSPCWPSIGRLEVNDLTIAYPGCEPVLSNLTFQVEPGQKLLLRGRSGSGKKTLLSSFLRLGDYSGTIRLDGIDIAQIPRPLLQQRPTPGEPAERIAWALAQTNESQVYSLDADYLAGAVLYDYNDKDVRTNPMLQDGLTRFASWENETKKYIEELQAKIV
ncbi:hypothetical protein GQ53DRAFT_822126 [Thozetella sp. PMI_491]|nr:hypothetical protein GQ53DRAFT_822126 [Thozetella sp. PMI_491]